jgi:hypothetical protein
MTDDALTIRLRVRTQPEQAAYVAGLRAGARLALDRIDAGATTSEARELIETSASLARAALADAPISS